jgi:hypothetical protein
VVQIPFLYSFGTNTCPQTNDFKAAMKQAKDLAMSLPGGELLITEQDEIIAMLEALKDRKKFVISVCLIHVHSYAIAKRREMLAEFAKRVLPEPTMDIDSTASTPNAFPR